MTVTLRSVTGMSATFHSHFSIEILASSPISQFQWYERYQNGPPILNLTHLTNMSFSVAVCKMYLLSLFFRGKFFSFFKKSVAVYSLFYCFSFFSFLLRVSSLLFFFFALFLESISTARFISDAYHVFLLPSSILPNSKA